jgi:hypothetical protein
MNKILAYLILFGFFLVLVIMIGTVPILIITTMAGLIVWAIMQITE